MAAGHNNVAAVGTSASNTKYGTNFLSSYKLNDIHNQVVVLKDNLRTYRSITPSYLWTGVTSLSGNTTSTFDNATRDNLLVFQSNESIGVDGIYGAEARNRMHAVIGISPMGFVRVFRSTAYYINYNDTAAGLAADSTYRLDHGWVTSSTRDTLQSLGFAFFGHTSKKIEINDCSLIDGADTPEHSSHMDGKDVDIRNQPMTAAEEKKFLEVCIANSNVQNIRFHTAHGLSSTKIVLDSSHNDHFHLDFFN